MFERLLGRVEEAAERRAKALAARLAERLRERLPGGIAGAMEGGVRLSGRDLLRRVTVDPALRWLVLDCARDEGEDR